jgi:hypothetical protein
MEDVARTMAALDKKRTGIRKEGASDTYERTSARLAELKAEEKAAKKRLKELIRRDLFEEWEETEGDEYTSGNEIVDAISDGIVRGIQVVTDVICAPLEWLTSKLM